MALPGSVRIAAIRTGTAISNDTWELLLRPSADTTPAIHADGADTAFVAAELSILPPIRLGIRCLIYRSGLLGFFLSLCPDAGLIRIRRSVRVQKPANPAPAVSSNNADTTVVTAKPAVFPIRIGFLAVRNVFGSVSHHFEVLLSGNCLLNLLRFRR